MKKNKFSILFVTVLSISLLIGCSSPVATPTSAPTPTEVPATPTPAEIPATPTPEPTLTLVLEDVYQACMAYQTANSGTEAPFMFPGDFSDPYWDASYPGLSSLDLKQVVLYNPPIATFACEVVLVEAANAEDLETIRSILEDRIEYGVTSSSCDPENALLWQTNARIYQEGNYIGMIVLPGEYIIFETIFSEIK